MYKSVVLSLIVMALWGSLFPCVKIGYAEFGISSGSVADILLFAAMRFIVCGVVVVAYCLIKGRTMQKPTFKEGVQIVWVGLFAIVLHYACTYLGLASTDSSKTALLKQVGALIYVCFSFLFFKDEKFSIYKIIGAICGFCGIVALNFSKGSVSFAFGDVLILCASFCTVASNIISRKTAQSCAPLWITGISQLFGGIVLLFAALVLGAQVPTFSSSAILIFTYICAASIVSYTLWYYVLKTNELSKMFIIKFAEPLFACLFGAVLLGENIFSWQYLVSFVLVSVGVTIGHMTKKPTLSK